MYKTVAVADKAFKW